MEHNAKDFNYLLGKLKGISDNQLKAHFGLYEGYVKKLNEIETKLKTADRAASNYSFGEYSELKRREVVAFNGAYLHEMYFENLLATGAPSDAFKKSAESAFGDWDKFVADVKAAAGSTPGWVMVTWNSIDNQLHTYIMFEHHIGLPAHQHIVLALDCWEHAFMIDYGTKKAEYLNAFFNNINWDIVNKRFDAIKGGK
ncbi:hypothetical protein HY490_05205 [Candidatus Woesearchaeota archaeon]|nr:hypothetical protein [Candidatus Woesearchaeota archaeon]